MRQALLRKDQSNADHSKYSRRRQTGNIRHIRKRVCRLLLLSNYRLVPCRVFSAYDKYSENRWLDSSVNWASLLESDVSPHKVLKGTGPSHTFEGLGSCCETERRSVSLKGPPADGSNLIYLCPSTWNTGMRMLELGRT